MYRAVRNFTFDGDAYVADLTRVAADHPARELHPENFTYDLWAPAVSERSIERARENRDWTPDELRWAEESVDERRERIRKAAENPNALEAGAPPATTRRRDTRPGGEDREAGLRAVDELRNELSAAAGDQLEELIRKDRSGRDSRYIGAVSSPHYASAFGKRLANPEGAQHEYTPEEAEAVRRVADVLAEQRALGVSTGPGGEFAVPATLDPSVTLTSDGRVNPIRELATVTSIVSDRWAGAIPRASSHTGTAKARRFRTIARSSASRRSHRRGCRFLCLFQSRLAKIGSGSNPSWRSCSAMPAIRSRRPRSRPAAASVSHSACSPQEAWSPAEPRPSPAITTSSSRHCRHGGSRERRGCPRTPSKTAPSGRWPRRQLGAAVRQRRPAVDPRQALA